MPKILILWVLCKRSASSICVCGCAVRRISYQASWAYVSFKHQTDITDRVTVMKCWSMVSLVSHGADSDAIRCCESSFWRRVMKHLETSSPCHRAHLQVSYDNHIGIYIGIIYSYDSYDRHMRLIWHSISIERFECFDTPAPQSFGLCSLFYSGTRNAPVTATPLEGP